MRLSARVLRRGTFKSSHEEATSSIPIPFQIRNLNQQQQQQPLTKTPAMSDETAESKFHLLPDEVVGNILLMLPSKSIARFRCVCKSWLSITTHHSFLLDHTHRSPNNMLIHTTRRHSENPNLRHINFQLLPPTAAAVLPDRRRSTADAVVASCDGLLCFLDNLHERLNGEENVPCYYVINPLTGAQIDLPKPTCAVGHIMGLYFHTPTGEYRLLRRTNCSSLFDRVELISLNGEAWRALNSSPPRESVSARTPVRLNGMLYWVAYNALVLRAIGILGFDITKEEFKLVPLPPVDTRIFANSSLLNMGDRLTLIIIDRELSAMGEMGIDVWVFRGFENVAWEKTYSVKCISGLDRIDFGTDYWVDDTALCVKKDEIMILSAGPRLYLIQFDLNARKYKTAQVLDPEEILWHFSLLYKESLVSHDSFIR